jgi:hypothetical protein
VLSEGLSNALGLFRVEIGVVMRGIAFEKTAICGVPISKKAVEDRGFGKLE